MKILGIIDEDFINYKTPCMTIEMPWCTFKCDKENGTQICQNGALANAPKYDIDNQAIIKRYLDNPITEAICFQGLEPFDSSDFQGFLEEFRQQSDDLIIIYTGYILAEVLDRYPWIYSYHNIIIKYGRFIPNAKCRMDEVLGVRLASDNQYASYYD